MPSARHEFAFSPAVASPDSAGVAAINASFGTAPLNALVASLRASVPSALAISAQGWDTNSHNSNRIHLVVVMPPGTAAPRTQVLTALPAALHAAVNAGAVRMAVNTVASDYMGAMGSPGAGYFQVATASWAAPAGGGATTMPPANYDRCAMGASPEAFTAYREEWGALSGSNAVTVPALTTLKVLGRARRTISGPSDNRLLQIELLRGALAGQKVWVVSSPESTQALRNNGCAAVDVFAADSRANPTGGSQGSTSNPTPAPPPAPLPAVIPAQASAGGDLAMWIVFGSLAGAGYLVWDKMKRRGRRSRG